MPLLATCICPTHNRPPKFLHLLEECVESFRRQTYPSKELLILNDTPGQILKCDVPGVRIINTDIPYSSLGDKHNAMVLAAEGQIILSWDDDDISLPWRIETSVAKLSRGIGYYNPKRYWYKDGRGYHHTHNCGNGHMCSAYTKSAWLMARGYPSVSTVQDAAMDTRLIQCKDFGVDLTTPAKRDWFYIYRWGVSPHHLSSRLVEHKFYEQTQQAESEDGEFKIVPAWKENYTAETRRILQEDNLL